MFTTEGMLTKEKQYQKLKTCSDNKNVDDWNKWHEQPNRMHMINLSGLDLSGMWLKGIDFSYANLEGADLSNSHLENANLNYANLKKTNLTETHLERNQYGILNKFDEKVNFEGATLINTYMQGIPLKNANFTNATLLGTHFEEAKLPYLYFGKVYCYLDGVHFEGADLYCANFTGIDLNNIHFEESPAGKKTRLRNAIFKNTSIRNTNFANADMDYADFTNAALDGSVVFEGAILRCSLLAGAKLSVDEVNANLKSSDFTGAIVNGNTVIHSCDIDRKTNFTMVDLDSALIEPSLLTALKTNVRRFAWNKYYDSNKDTFWSKIKTWPIRLFWWLSDYGCNTARIFKTFFCAGLFFTIIYLAIANFNQNPVVLSNFNLTGNRYLNIFVSFCFAISTMVTLGFAGINVTIQESSPWGSFLALMAVTMNLMVGYFILAVFVTRLGILFQSLAPEQKVGKTKIK